MDGPVIRLNEEALPQLRCEKQLRIVPGAAYLSEEPGALEQVARLAAEWVRAARAASFECSHGLTPDVKPDQGDNRFNRGETYG